MINRDDKEVQQYRDLVQVPDTFPKAVGPKMIVAAVFLGFLMVPGSIYLTLFMGQSLGPAARWVTVILFAEVAKRSMKDLKQQEIYLLFYMAGIAMTGAMAEVAQTNLSGGILSQLLWNQYLVDAPAMKAMGVATQVPEWVAPPAEVIEQEGRTFFTSAWAGPIAFLLGVMILNRVDNFGLGYALYRLTAHVERLPFPMAPVGALGISALSETREDRSNRWRWRWFSTGGMLGIGFGAIYVGVPAVTGSVFGQAIQIIPIPWLDLTDKVSSTSFLPAVPINIVFDASHLILGMVLPFWAVVGGFVGLMVTYILNPILFRTGNLTSWEEGMGVVDTLYNNHVDFYLSFSIGLAIAIFLISVSTVVIPLYKRLRNTDTPAEANEERMTFQRIKQVLTRNPARGDLSIWLALIIYFASTMAYILLAEFLIEGFPALFFLGFAFVYQPIISYVTAKLEGLVGQVVQIPMVREAAYIFSGYQGAAIWFAPIPINDYGRTTQDFRIMELLGTRVTDVIKIEIIAIPILAGASLLFCELIWRLGELPSDLFPFTQEVWDLKAKMFALHVTATAEGTSEFLEAVKFDVIGYGLAAGVGSYAILSYMHLPTFLVFGAVRGLGQSSPGAMILELVGAIIGRYYFQRKLGHQRYKQYVAILFAGYSAGVGLIAMAAVAIALIARSTMPLGY